MAEMTRILSPQDAQILGSTFQTLAIRRAQFFLRSRTNSESVLDVDDAAARRASSLTFLVHPAELPTNGRRECAVGMDAAFVSQCNMREEHGKELDAAGELVVAPEPRMEPSPPVEDATVVLVLGGELAN